MDADPVSPKSWMMISPSASSTEPSVPPGSLESLSLPETLTTILPQPEGVFTVPEHEKWSLKNEPKWTRTPNGGARLPGTSIVPIKSWKEDSPHHCPDLFLLRHPGVGLVIDLTATPSSYEAARFGSDPSETSPEGVRLTCHRKLPGVSKQLPSEEEVERFCTTIRNHLAVYPLDLVVVHCHYGFNRTGFMCVSYLVLECGVPVDEAIQTFAEVRSPGIKHDWFISGLRERYATQPAPGS
eukprot:Hpha_TRINITY_DN12495_c0_g1::TRINITY_DN12495_c0_g1_i1::g.43003::m.43003